MPDKNNFFFGYNCVQMCNESRLALIMITVINFQSRPGVCLLGKY